MTVIAYKGGRMACDSLCSDVSSGLVAFQGNKIFRTRAGALVGCSGAADSRSVLALLQDVKTGKQMPTSQKFADTKCESENGILIVLPDGEIWIAYITFDAEGQEWSADACRVTGFNGMAYAGCGGGYAMTAMKAGKSAKEACAIACEMSAFCRPPIYEHLLHPKKKAKKGGSRRQR